jgi:hypothetical protein
VKDEKSDASESTHGAKLLLDAIELRDAGGAF